MKAERRHDLKTNALASALTDFPAFMRDYGSRVLLGGVFIVLVGVLIYQCTAGRNVRDAQAREALTTARDNANRIGQMIEQLAQMPFMMVPPETIGKFRDQAATDATKALDVALTTSNSDVKADAEIVRGDLNYMLGSFPALPGSATRPSLNGDRTSDDYLRTAEDAYNNVLRAGLSAASEAARNARFGLAAIAENRHKWDDARQFYQQVIDNSSTPDLFKNVARERQDSLKNLSKPMLIGTRTTPIEAPFPMPGGPLGPMLPGLPATAPTTALATAPAAGPTTAPSPATQPAARP